MLNSIFTAAGVSAIGKVTMEELVVAIPVVLVLGIGLIYWINKAYKKEQMK